MQPTLLGVENYSTKVSKETVRQISKTIEEVLATQKDEMDIDVDTLAIHSGPEGRTK